MIQKKISSSLSRQSSETKPRTNVVFVSRESMVYLEFNKPNKQNVSEINLFKKFNFSQCKNNCWPTDRCQEWNIKTSLRILKIGKIKTWPCFPMRKFLSVLGHNSELRIANHSSRSTVSQLKCVSDTISNWIENHQPQKTKISTVIYAPFIKTGIKNGY